MIDEIRNCEIRIEGNNEQISILNEKIHKMEETYNKLLTLQNTFLEHIENKQNRVNILNESCKNTRFIMECTQESQELLTGSEVQKAGDSIEAAIKQVQYKISMSYDEVKELENKNQILNSRMGELDISRGMEEI